MKRHGRAYLWPFLLPFLLLVAGLFFVAYRVVQTLSGPMVGLYDVNINEHISYLFGQLLTWKPYPQLNYQTDLLAYPYGTQAALQTWCFEREWFYFLFSHFGEGPWLALYFLFSLTVSMVGAWILLMPEVGSYRAALAGFVLTFFNFYCMHKFPGHFNLVAVHWINLSLITQYRLARSVFEQGVLSLRLGLLSVLFLILSLGLDLGYGAGFALASAVLTFIYGVWHLRKKRALKALFSVWKKEFLNHKLSCFALVFLILVALFFIFPLSLQLVLVFKTFAKFQTPSYWANPVRFLLPWLGNLGASWPNLTSFLGDQPEGYGALSPGWTLVLPALYALYVGFQKKKTYLYPFFLLFVLGLFFHPTLFPTLKLFPWFSEMRVSARFTLVLPVLLVLFILSIEKEITESSKVTKAIFIGLATLEFLSAYYSRPFDKPLVISPEYRALLQTIKSSPGEAVLDWPFCATGGNGDIDGLCPELPKNLTAHTWQRFHGKRAMGFYFGRISRDLTLPFLAAGWDLLLKNNHSKPQACFDKRGRDFFRSFFAAYPFAGIQLYTELVPEACKVEFRKWLGEPAAAARNPESGWVEFYLRPAALSIKPVEKLGYYPDPIRDIDLLHPPSGARQIEEGWGVEFSAKEQQNALIDLKIVSYLTRQKLTLICNAEQGEEILLPYSQRVSFQRMCPIQQGWNRVVLKLAQRGRWVDVLERYWFEKGVEGFLHPSQMNQYYKQNRHQPAILERGLLKLEK